MWRPESLQGPSTHMHTCLCMYLVYISISLLGNLAKVKLKSVPNIEILNALYFGYFGPLGKCKCGGSRPLCGIFVVVEPHGHCSNLHTNAQEPCGFCQNSLGFAMFESIVCATKRVFQVMNKR